MFTSVRAESRVSTIRNGVDAVNLFVEVDEKYPVTSTTSSTSCSENRHTVPSADTGTITRFGRTRPGRGFRFDTTGRGPPQAKTVT